MKDLNGRGFCVCQCVAVHRINNQRLSVALGYYRDDLIFKSSGQSPLALFCCELSAGILQPTADALFDRFSAVTPMIIIEGIPQPIMQDYQPTGCYELCAGAAISQNMWCAAHVFCYRR